MDAVMGKELKVQGQGKKWEVCTEFLTIANFINFHITDNVAMLENNTDLM